MEELISVRTFNVRCTPFNFRGVLCRHNVILIRKVVDQCFSSVL